MLHTLPVHSNIAFDVISFVRSRRVQNVVFTQGVRNGGKRNASGSKPLWVSKLIKFYKNWSHVKAPPARNPLASSTATGLVRPTRSSCQETMTTRMGLWRPFQVVLEQRSVIWAQSKHFHTSSSPMPVELRSWLHFRHATDNNMCGRELRAKAT